MDKTKLTCGIWWYIEVLCSESIGLCNKTNNITFTASANVPECIYSSIEGKLTFAKWNADVNSQVSWHSLVTMERVDKCVKIVLVLMCALDATTYIKYCKLFFLILIAFHILLHSYPNCCNFKMTACDFLLWAFHSFRQHKLRIVQDVSFFLRAVLPVSSDFIHFYV